jgi:hypothetical protein
MESEVLRFSFQDAALKTYCPYEKPTSGEKVRGNLTGVSSLLGNRLRYMLPVIFDSRRKDNPEVVWFGL